MTASKADRKAPIQIGDISVKPGHARKGEIPIARLPTGAWVSLPLKVINGKRGGPALWLSAAIHGEELNGVEIIRQVLEAIDPREFRGSLFAVPIVNVFGYLAESRYLPDRRDLNRSFPGSPRGSLAARMANMFMTEIVDRCQYGIDLHTGSDHRANLPQIRADLEDPETLRCAEAFGAPICIHARSRDGSLREAAAKRGVRVLLFEGGEPHRFDSYAIDAGVRGVFRVLSCLDMYHVERKNDPGERPLCVTRTRWIRAGRSGIVRLNVDLGDEVGRRQKVGVISDALGDRPLKVRAPVAGIVIGQTRDPVAHRGDALVHLAVI